LSTYGKIENNYGLKKDSGRNTNQNMELDQIRKQINAVDDAMHRYFTDRLRCSEDVAEAKLQTQDSVYKPEREKQVYARFPGDADEEKLYRLYVRKVMQLSRYHQYGIFLGKGNVDTEFETQYRSVQAAINERDTTDASVKIELTPDPQAEQGMSIQDMLSVLGDFGTEVTALQYEGSKVSVTVRVSGTDALESQRRLFYMLYKESVTYKMYVL
jgi:chorismate mutase